MNRISIQDKWGSGNWFDKDKAKCYDEGIYFDSHCNEISLCSQISHGHEALYMTQSGKFIINRWTDWTGDIETYELISKEEAAKWFIINEYSDNLLPDIFKKDVQKLEIQ